MKTIYFAGGCFWGMQKYLKLINGVVSTEVGFANGFTASPSYKQVYTDTTGYAETVKVEYDSDVVSLNKLVEFFFHAIDPLSVNQQGEDKGTRYRTGVYFTDKDEYCQIEEVFNEVRSNVGADIAVELCPLKNFYPAEEYHQNYLEKNPQGYCHLRPELFEFAKQINR